MRRKAFHLLLAAALLAAACTPKVKPLKTCIFPGDYPDPTILRDGNDFYMTHSSFTYFPGLLVWHSTDLLHWEPVARAVEDGDYSIFAPDICKVDGRFYIYYPTSRGENYVVVADRPEGPWSAPVKLDVGGIDPGHVVAEDGQRYLYTNNGWVTPLTPDGLAAAGKPQKVYDGWEFPKEWETEGMWLESPKLFKRGGWYYLVSAEGGTAGPATSHMVVVARSKSALGPWENSPHNPMVHTYSADEAWWSKGHGTLVDDADGNWYIVYHAYRNGFHTLGRSTIVESVAWTEDGWPVLAEKDGAKWEKGGLQGDYAYLRDYANPLLWSRWQPGFGGASLWLTTAVDESYEITARFSIPEGSQAGLFLFYNEQANIGLTGSDPAFALRIRNERNTVSVWEQTGDGAWEPVMERQDVSEMHHNRYQGFFALRPAYLLGDGAELLEFTYKPL
ncbi:Glycosyl hydrolases family 43 [Bacteroidales bacterium WCE2004]|nr:Glycosyl hydrolases family 43 [Bacteroidales bacterium WCE2004]